MEKQLKLYQLEAVNDILHKKRMLIADDMSLGKCAESIVPKTLIEKRQGYESKTLIVCPASVAEHWEDEIKSWYKKKANTKISRIQTPTYDSDIKNIENADFVIIGYPTLSYFGNQKSKIDRLVGLGFQYGIIDEAHNAKNPESIRSKGVKSLFDSMEYLAILSGTPIPNTVVDIYMLLSLLDKENFPIDVENSKAVLNDFYNRFRADPEFVRRILNDRMIRRTVKDYLHNKFPELKQSDLEVRLEGEHRDAYLQIYYNDDIKPASKLIQLRLASLDPNLVNPHLLNSKLASRIGKMESSIYESLDDIVEEVTDSNGKVLVFSDFREGVTNKLKERYEKYGAVVIDGNVTSMVHENKISKREQVRKKFQQNPDCKILIATTVMDEGVDLTAATDVVHLTLPYTPATLDQRNRRVQRIGEVEKDHVNVHVVKPGLDKLIPSITEGIERLLHDKKRIITYILEQPFSLTKQDLDEIKNGKEEKSKNLVPLISSPVSSINRHLGLLKGQGFNKILKHYGKYPKEAEYIARLYASHWEGYYGGNTATLYTKVINVLEEKEKLERKLDIASGPFSLSRRLKKQVTNLDLNEYMLNAGRVLESEGRIVPGNTAIKSPFHDLPFKDNSFDLTACSLALHMSKLKVNYNGKELRERELALRETNRVLRNNGYAILTLPHTIISEKDLPNFHNGLEKLGFEVLSFSGFYKGPKDSRFKVYLAGLRKRSEPCEEALDDKFLVWKMDKQLGTFKRKAKKKKKHHLGESKNKNEREFVTQFYHTKRRKSLEDSVRESIDGKN